MNLAPSRCSVLVPDWLWAGAHLTRRHPRPRRRPQGRIGNLYRVTPVDDAAAAVDAAWEAGLRYFDTAPHCGLGLSERRLGAALRGRPRDEYVISSQVGRLLVPNEEPRGVDTEGFVVRDDLRRQWDFSRDGVLRSIEDTLERTGLDRLDVVYLHDPDDHWPAGRRGGHAHLAELSDQGVIGAIGAGMNQSAMLARFLRETAADVAMPAGAAHSWTSRRWTTSCPPHENWARAWWRWGSSTRDCSPGTGPPRA
ncbi:aldo/keto reductase [Streptomyces viridochromogenes]|uniref:aldo/keto reductase n=1 Tax=Streptomyces viridochromogenes TaxID=1938 RepID=UPI000B1A337E